MLPNICPTEEKLSAFSDGLCQKQEENTIREHVMACKDCLEALSLAQEARKKFNKTNTLPKKHLFLVLAVASFGLSFVIPRYFLQFLAITLILGFKWAIDTSATRTIIMSYINKSKSGNEHLDKQRIKW